MVAVPWVQRSTSPLIDAQVEICHHDTTGLFELFREWFGPVSTVWRTLAGPQREEFRDSWIALADKFNIAGDGTCEIPFEYLEVVAVKA